MITGMTGFGSAQISSDDGRVIVEVKSLNHRYFDITYYMPIGFASLENKIRQIIEKEIERGRVSVSVKILQKSTQKISLNKGNVKEYMKYASILEKEFGLKDALTLSDLVKLPGVLEIKESFINPEVLWSFLERGVKKALSDLIYMRKKEGRSLAMNLSDISKRMLLKIKIIQKRKEIILKEKKIGLSLEEFSAFQKSNDINEEVTRLIHYIDELKLLLKSTLAVGKKIDFIAQEMQRETNTIGAKCQDLVISNTVIALKNKIEKIREQSQNIE